MTTPIKSKYRAQRTIIDGIKFDSKKEAMRYSQLALLQKQSIISNLRLQVSYELNEGGKFSYKYRADFVYMSEGKTIVEDCKGYKTREFKKKAKLMKGIYGIDIKIT